MTGQRVESGIIASLSAKGWSRNYPAISLDDLIIWSSRNRPFIIIRETKTLERERERENEGRTIPLRVVHLFRYEWIRQWVGTVPKDFQVAAKLSSTSSWNPRLQSMLHWIYCPPTCTTPWKTTFAPHEPRQPPWQPLPSAVPAHTSLSLEPSFLTFAPPSKSCQLLPGWLLLHILRSTDRHLSLSPSSSCSPISLLANFACHCGERSSRPLGENTSYGLSRVKEIFLSILLEDEDGDDRNYSSLINYRRTLRGGTLVGMIIRRVSYFEIPH